MAKDIRGLAGLREYLERAVGRAEHHAPSIVEVMGHLVVAVILYHEKDSMVCRTYAGKTANILRFRVNGKDYAFRHNHASGGSVELHENDEHGPVTQAFTNSDFWDDVRTVFESL